MMILFRTVFKVIGVQFSRLQVKWDGMLLIKGMNFQSRGKYDDDHLVTTQELPLIVFRLRKGLEP